jgi:uncharacterized membrane protein
MKEAIVDQIQQLPPPIATFLIAMLPIFELRGAIPFAWSPLANNFGHTHPFLTWLIAVCGNFVPVYPILTLLGPADRHLRKFPIADRFLNWLFKRTVSRSKLINRYKALGLILFVAIPAPMTGAWTGSVAAYLFKIPLRTAIPCIIMGISIAGVVMSLVSMGALKLWHL